MEDAGYGHVVASVGKLSGEVPYTTFYARKSFIRYNIDTIRKFNNALNKAIKYTLYNDSKTVAKAIIEQFPDTSIDDLSSMIERYKEYDCWLENTHINEGLFTNLEDFLIDFELIDDYVPFNDLVKNISND